MDRRLFFLMTRAQHRLFRHVDRQSEVQFGISVTQLGVLMYLDRHPGVQQTELSRELGLNKPAITGLVSRMENNQLVRRESCPDDGRASRLYLTEEGKAKAAVLPPFISMLNARMTEGFSDDEIDVVLRFLNATLERF